MSNSFTGDTEVGDGVVASDPTTGATDVRVVSALIGGAGVKDMVTVAVATAVATADGERQELEATGGHPFWVENRSAWVDAADLEVGDVLIGADGEQARVAEVEQRRALLRVHNLTVDGPHTYHVVTGDTAVLVHNSNCADARDLPFRDVDRNTEVNRTLDRIESDGPFRHAQDGTSFKNREHRLPARDTGHYREYTVETLGSPDRGARRIVTGASGEAYYTDDHYRSFIQIDPTRRSP